jgi:glycosyltransferase involved in cell wall biosynthesis
MNYPEMMRNQNAIARKVDFYTQRVDFLLPGLMGPDGIGRWDIPMPNTLHIDVQDWTVRDIKANDNENEELTITHSPNHRGVKGTEFLLKAVENLKKRGYKVNLLLLESMLNKDVKSVLEEKSDIHVELLIGPGHGLSAIEGMSAGIPVISNLSFDQQYEFVRRWSFFSECPLISATPENIEVVLERLISDKKLRIELGGLGRKYVERYHSYEEAIVLFKAIFNHLKNGDADIINFYHPILSKRMIEREKIHVPLINNRLPGISDY